MSISHSKRSGPTPQDAEFNAMEESVDIIPLISLPEWQGLDGASAIHAALKPPSRSTVPLWVAVHLKQKRKCRIVAPNWMGVQELEQTLHNERTVADFSDVPSTYIELSKVLLEVASDDIPSPDRVRLLLKDIREARQAKIREGLKALNPIHLAMPNLSSLEISELRPFFTLSHKRLLLLDPHADAQADIERLWMEKPEVAKAKADRGELDYEDSYGGGEGEGRGGGYGGREGTGFGGGDGGEEDFGGMDY